MATYVYETIPKKPGEKPKRYEIQHSMKDEPLKKHPETGEPIRRIVFGGLGLMSRGATEGRPPNWEILEKGPRYDKDPHDHGHEHMHDHHH
jgi:hypothetical protein